MNNKENFIGQDSVDKIKEIADKTNVCMFCTNLKTFPFSTCPMSPQLVDNNGEIWFFSDRFSDHNADLERDSNVQLLFANTGDSKYLSIAGQAHLVDDRQKVEELWEPMVKTWFPGGVDDPKLTLIRFRPQEGYYWDTKHGKAVAFLKMVASAAVGKTMDDSVEGQLKI